MTRKGFLALSAASVAALAGGVYWWRRAPAGPDDAEFAERYATPLPPPEGPLSVYHIGHSLVGRDMPAMLAQLAGPGHRFESQLGWGAPIRSHWGDIPVNGFDVENAHPRYRDAREAVASGEYDAIVLTEAVEIRDALRYHDSPRYLAAFAEEAWTARPEARLYLYETWHPLNDPQGWLDRVDADLGRYWEGGLLRPALGRLPPGARLHLIPGGQAMASLVRAVESGTGVGGLRSRADLFLDDIHFNDVGAYFMALVHYATLYGKDPAGLPHRLHRADGSPADAPDADAARLMQKVAWETVRAIPRTGVAGERPP